MDKEVELILDKLKDSINYPIIDVPTMDGTDSEPMENTVLLEPNESKILFNYITNLQQIEQDHQKLNGELREENKKLQEENEKAMKLLKEFYDSVNYDEIIALLEKYEQFKGLKEGK